VARTTAVPNHCGAEDGEDDRRVGHRLILVDRTARSSPAQGRRHGAMAAAAALVSTSANLSTKALTEASARSRRARPVQVPSTVELTQRRSDAADHIPAGKLISGGVLVGALATMIGQQDVEIRCVRAITPSAAAMVMFAAGTQRRRRPTAQATQTG